jgi:hypothetical protein
MPSALRGRQLSRLQLKRNYPPGVLKIETVTLLLLVAGVAIVDLDSQAFDPVRITHSKLPDVAWTARALESRTYNSATIPSQVLDTAQKPKPMPGPKPKPPMNGFIIFICISCEAS